VIGLVGQMMALPLTVQDKSLRFAKEVFGSEFDSFKDGLDLDVSSTPRSFQDPDADVVARVFQGDLRGFSFEDLVQPRGTVSFFISSTFADTKIERDLFMFVCVPRLRKLCKLVGLELEVKEMRWGITNTLSASHQTSKICMQELEECVKTSASVSFVGIIGNRYGYRPFPSEIPCSQFERLFDVGNEVAKALLRKWWRRDDLSGQYVLRTVTDLIPSYNSEVADEAWKEWWKENFEPLQKELREAARNGLEKEESLPFIQSVTETEMRFGFKKSSDSLLILRDLKRPKKPEGPFFDETDCEEMLQQLRNFARSKASKVLHFKLDEESVEEDRDKLYLRGMLKEWSSYLEERILAVPTIRREPLFDEVCRHFRFAWSRADVQDDSEEQLRFLNATEGHVLIVGPSGCGKSSLLSRYVISNGEAGERTICARFCGLTQASSSAFPLLRSLCEQLSNIFGIEMDTKMSNSRLPDFFREGLVGKISEPVTIVLDSLDQLDEAESSALNFFWLPNTFPPNFRLIISCLDSSPARTAITTWISLDSLISIDNLQPSQFETLAPPNAKISQNLTEPSMLLLAILRKEALQKRSFEGEMWSAGITSTEEAINQLVFERIELSHGPLLTQASLALITFSKDGLSRRELEDLLSMRNDVLEISFKWWRHPLGRMPSIEVARLLSNIEPYIIDDGTVKWFHRQFKEAASKRYQSQRTRSLELLKIYFDGDAEQHLERFVVGGDWIGQERFLESFADDFNNLRKLRELPHAMIQAEDDLSPFVFDVRAILGFFECDIGDDLDALLAFSSDVHSGQLRRALRLCSSILRNNPLQLGSQLLARLGGTDHPVLSSIELHFHPALPWLRPLRPFYFVVADGLERVFMAGSATEVGACAISSDSRLIACFLKSSRILVCSYVDGIRVSDFMVTPSESVFLLKFSKSESGHELISASFTGRISCWNLVGRKLWSVQGHSQSLHGISTYTERSGFVTCGHDEDTNVYIRVWSQDGELQFSFCAIRSYEPSNLDLNLYFACSNDGLACALLYDDRMYVWSLEDVRRIASIEVPRFFKSICFSSGSEVVSHGWNEEDETENVFLWTIGDSSLQLRRTWTLDTDVISSLHVLQEDRLLSVDTHGFIEIWNTDGDVISEIGRHKGFGDVSFNDGADWFVTAGGDDGTVRVWRIEEIPPQEEEKYKFQCEIIALSPDGSFAASFAPTDGIRLWNMETGRLVIKIDSIPLLSGLSFSRDSALLQGVFEYGGRSSGLRKFLWRIPDGIALNSDRVSFQRGEVDHVNFDGNDICEEGMIEFTANTPITLCLRVGTSFAASCRDGVLLFRG